MPSLNFPGQVHQWRLSQLLQKGYLRAHTSLLNDLALAARFIIVTAKTRIFGHFFSVTQAARAFLKGFWRLLDMFIGVPSLLAHNIDYKIKEERCRYLVAELVCRVSCRRNPQMMHNFAKYAFAFFSLNTRTVSIRYVRTYGVSCVEPPPKSLMSNVNRPYQCRTCS